MKSNAIKRETMGAQICNELRSSILSGEFAPGDAITETALALRFGVSRAPLREAMRQLIDEGLLVSKPYTGTRVLELSTDDINDIYSMRICLEIFAFEQIWDRRGPPFEAELKARHQALLKAVDGGDDVKAIDAELDLHGLVYELSGNKILLSSWMGIRGRLQLYWAAHHRAHGITGPKRESHDDYIRLALGNSIEEMRNEIQSHMRRGLETTKAFVETQTA
ncbi:MAG: GntR family transcriptional regulator [Rhodobacteraceae bacterium]|uniref:GntR family transcriptional regulator n=1 Tax=Celeribacter sp. HF31 TaxID=2721558 RepID=UPI00143150D7|nr:GntR family transcriptional regulator [Celeribacter sp. HF31]NIY79856.1 GntR family transcriptional regulator [Celeribacter sp. HF31]NVK47002.1 GntR family transcriptional regulator [Paracoccaceae bacterium]